MKVLHIIDSLGVGGGAEHSLASLLPALRQRGIESSVVCLLPREGGLQEQLTGEGFDVTVLPPGSWRTRVASLRQLVAHRDPDLVHATLVHSCLAARLACRTLDVPLVNSIVTTSYDPVRRSELRIPAWKLHALRIIDGTTARRLVDHFHVITDVIRDELLDVHAVDPRRITTIPRGRSASALGTRTPERRASTRAELGIADDVPVVLNVGRQDSAKAQEDLVRAFRHLLERRPDALLLIAGRPGDASDAVRSAVEQSDVGDSVRLLGHRSDVPDLMAAADVFAFPSRYEGLGCALIEAMALSVPIVGSDAAAVSEVLGGGEFGMVVSRGDVSGLGDALFLAVDDEGLRQGYVERARARYEERYELERVADATAAMYRELLPTRLAAAS